MSLEAVRRIADAVLYEGYILYPYRASAQKNRSRWQWGVIMGPGYAAADSSERDFTQAEVLLEHSGQPAVTIMLRFLQVQRRSTEAAEPGMPAQTWDEAVEREIEFTVGPDDLLGPGYRHDFTVDGGQEHEPLGGANGDGGPDRNGDGGPDGKRRVSGRRRAGRFRGPQA